MDLYGPYLKDLSGQIYKGVMKIITPFLMGFVGPSECLNFAAEINCLLAIGF